MTILLPISRLFEEAIDTPQFVDCKLEFPPEPIEMLVGDALISCLIKDTEYQIVHFEGSSSDSNEFLSDIPRALKSN